MTRKKLIKDFPNFAVIYTDKDGNAQRAEIRAEKEEDVYDEFMDVYEFQEVKAVTGIVKIK